MANKLAKAPRTKAPIAKKRRKKEWPDEEELMLREAIKYLIRHHGMFLVPTRRREILIKGCPAWIITVTLRYITGHEGYIGDLLYDGENFTFLTEEVVMDERARKIADDPEGKRKWDEYRASTLQAGKS